jgi:transcriptional regulator with XRE-family HTH domain
MAPERLTVCPSWDPAPPPLPARSALYPLAPVGVGTPDVESLTSYLTRLAAAHSVSPRILLVEAVVPLVGRRDLAKPVDNSLSAFWTTDARALNGTGRIARDWARAAATLTSRPDLRCLTLLSWREVLPARGLLRRVRAWCPSCYEEWRGSGQVVYEPLRWALAVVTACPRHRRRLRLACPHPSCRQPLPPLASRARPGHCSACGGWLGASAETHAGGDEAIDPAPSPWQAWVGETLGALLVATPPTVPPRRERIARVIAHCAAQTGSTDAFARAMHLGAGTVHQWRQGRHLPQLATLLSLCYRLDTPLLDLLLDDPIRVDPVPKHPPPPQDAPGARRAARKPFDAARLRDALSEVLRSPDEPPPSMRQVARRLGYAHADLHHHLPELCRAISARYLADRHRAAAQRIQRLRGEVRRATVQLHGQGAYPSSVRVAQLLTRPSHFRHPIANAAWHAALRDLGWET